MEDDWPPYANKNGTGLTNELIVASFNSVYRDVKFIIMPYSRVSHYLDSGKFVGGFNVPIDRDSKQNIYLLMKHSLMSCRIFMVILI
jgi:polar amino acid transport system substrate-binding protein